MYFVIFALWLALNGAVTVEIVLFGLAVTAGVGILAYALFGYTPKKDLSFFRRIILLLGYLPVLIFEIVRANLQVAQIILNKRRIISPALVTVETGLRSRFARFIMANSITLTPGTITVRTNGSRFTVHCLSKEMSEGIADGVLCRLLQKMEA